MVLRAVLPLEVEALSASQPRLAPASVIFVVVVRPVDLQPYVRPGSSSAAMVTLAGGFVRVDEDGVGILILLVWIHVHGGARHGHGHRWRRDMRVIIDSIWVAVRRRGEAFSTYWYKCWRRRTL